MQVESTPYSKSNANSCLSTLIFDVYPPKSIIYKIEVILLYQQLLCTITYIKAYELYCHILRTSLYKYAL